MIQVGPVREKLEPKQLRSYRWFAPADIPRFGHRSRMKQIGYSGGRVNRGVWRRIPARLVGHPPLSRTTGRFYIGLELQDRHGFFGFGQADFRDSGDVRPKKTIS